MLAQRVLRQQQFATQGFFGGTEGFLVDGVTDFGGFEHGGLRYWTCAASIRAGDGGGGADIPVGAGFRFDAAQGMAVDWH
ncbi:hypothetical protein GCM10027046_20270 [Uliginosibacterium flavum]